MTDGDGDRSDMLRFHFRSRFAIDEHTAEGLVDGHIGPDDAPPGYAPVARLFDVVTGPAQAHELDDEAKVLAMFVAERAAPAPVAQASGRRRKPLESRTARVVAFALAGTLALTGAAAAATGRLPDPAQGVAHDVLSQLGISIPGDPAAEPAVDPTDGRDRTTTAEDPTTTQQDEGRVVCTETSTDACPADLPGPAGDHQFPGPGQPPTASLPPVTPPADPPVSVPTTVPTSAPPVSIPTPPGR